MRSLYTIVALIGLSLMICSCKRNNNKVAESPKLSEEETSFLARLDGIVIPIIDMEDTSVEEAMDFLRMRSFDDSGRDVYSKGLSYMERQSQMPKESEYTESMLGNDGGDRPWPYTVTYRARNIRLLDVAIEIASQGHMDAFVTTDRVLLVPEGSKPLPKTKILRVLRQTTTSSQNR